MDDFLTRLTPTPQHQQHVPEIRSISTTGGEKGMKVDRYDLIPVTSLRELARLFGVGAGKYAERNWERGYEFSKSYSALMRHAVAWWGGEDWDSEMEVSHMTCVAWHAFALVHFGDAKFDQFDDRPKEG